VPEPESEPVPEPASEPVPEPKYRAMTVRNLTEGLGRTNTGIKMFVDIDCKDKVMPGAEILGVG
jgi:hypothetical protein